MIRLALAMLSLKSLRGEKVKIVHVRGHSGDSGNEGADYLARMGATKALLTSMTGI
jgi:ribonuclease HI